MKSISYKAIFAIVVTLDLKIERLDIKTAFLYDNINEKIYVE